MGTVYPERESKILEFKSTLKKYDGIIKTAVAFANGVGGRIIVGIDDVTRKIIGVPDELRDKIYDEFPNSLYDSTSPHLISQLYEQRIGDQLVMVIEIPPALKKPCFLRRDGLPKGVYIRIGSSTRQASDEIIEGLMRDNLRISYDESAIQTELTMLSKNLLQDYYKKISQEALIEDKIITRSEANNEVFYPTVAGILLFAEKPDQTIPEALTMCTRFAGTEGRDIIQTEEVKGPIKLQIDLSYNLILSWIKRNYQLQGVHMRYKTLVPEEALREAITNAVIHRKYSIPGATKIALYDDHLEIFSPGNFPGHININNLGQGITHFRNPVIGRMAHKMGIIEKLGSGIKLIFDSCRKAKLMPPLFHEDGDYVKVIFKFEPLKEEGVNDEELLLNLFKSRHILTTQEMIEYLQRSKNTVFKVLHGLINKGKVKQSGKGPATRYSLVPREDAEG
jgi:ATP-dependent DNA helicase RecG